MRCWSCQLNLVRVMPNAPSLLGKGMSGLYADSTALAKQIRRFINNASCQVK
ncbi:hypothetical protein OK016_06545 [Vibrio chagasii]|nr:hypothetical protein [Vibrio chagasii]